MSENQRREQLQWAKRAIDEYFWNRQPRDEVGVACEVAFEALIAEERGELVRVVRCRDCKYHDPEDMKCDCGGLARIGCNFALDDNYFCAYGEPREEAEAALAEREVDDG